MKKLILFLALVFVTGYLPAQWNNTVTGTDNYFKIRFTSSNVGYVIRNPGIPGAQIVRTANAAGSWVPCTGIPSHAIHDFHFIDDNNGFIVTDSGGVSSGKIHVFKTTNGGTSWVKISVITGTQSSYGKVYFTDALHGTVTDGYGLLWSTSNGGANWNTQMFGNAIFNDIEFPTPATGYIGCWDGTFSYYGIVLKTTDSGNTWNFHHTFPQLNTAIDCMSFVNDSSGFVSSVYGFMLKTTNGGTVWDTLGFMKHHGYDVQDMFFTSMTHGYAVDGAGNIHKTTDGAVTWQINWPADSVGTSLSGIFINGNIGYATGYNGNVLKNDNLSTVKEVKSELQLNIYPNPSHDGMLQVQIKNHSLLTVNIFNTSGQQVLAQSNFRGGPLNLSALENGLYYIRFANAEGYTTSKAVLISK